MVIGKTCLVISSIEHTFPNVFNVERGVIDKRCNPNSFKHVFYGVYFFEAHLSTHQSKMGDMLRKVAKKHPLNTSRKHSKKEPQSFSHCGSFDHLGMQSLAKRLQIFIFHFVAKKIKK